jgi:diguanylate cyclase (GGDEF)-like protein
VRAAPGFGRYGPWLAYLLLCSVLVGLTAFTHRWWGIWGATAVQFSTGFAVIVGIRRFRPRKAAFWWWLSLGLFAYAVAQAYWRIGYDGFKPPIPFRTLDDWLYFGAFALFDVALGVRALAGDLGARRRADAVDGLIMVLGLSSGTWQYIAEPFLANRHLDAWGGSLFWTYEVLELARMAFIAMLVMSGRVRSRAHQMVLAGTTVMLTGDVIFTAGLSNPISPPIGGPNAVWLFGSVLVGAAALYPDMAGEAPRTSEVAAIARTRLVIFVVLAIAGPVMVGMDAALGVRPDFAPGVWIQTALSVSVSILLILRMSMLGGIAQRRAAALEDALREQHALRAQLEHRATHDPLTGLGNRDMLTRRLTEALARPTGHRGWLMLLDLDGFKDVNDTLGHPVGDALLVALAGTFASSVPQGLVTRLGGDEFAVLLDDSDERGAVAVTRTILATAAQEHDLDGHRVRVSASIGLLLLDRAGDVSAALRDADIALYAAKGAGRNRYRLFRPADALPRTTSMANLS